MQADTGNRFLDAIVNKLQADGVGVVGKTLFAIYMPEEVLTGLVVVENQVYGQRVFDKDIPNYAKCQFRIVTRAPTYKAAFALAEAAAEKLAGVSRWIVDGIEVKTILQTNPPLGFPPSANTKAKEAVVNFSAIYGLTN